MDVAAMASACVVDDSLLCLNRVGRLRRLFWRVADALDYLVTLLRLRILDALAGPLPETPADQQRARDRERLRRAFPEIEP
jgi:hypothetical protein